MYRNVRVDTWTSVVCFGMLTNKACTLCVRLFLPAASCLAIPGTTEWPTAAWLSLLVANQRSCFPPLLLWHSSQSWPGGRAQGESAISPAAWRAPWQERVAIYNFILRSKHRGGTLYMASSSLLQGALAHAMPGGQSALHANPNQSQGASIQ